MKTMLFVILFFIAPCGVLAAQNVPPAVSSHVNCTYVPPSFGTWYQQTPLSSGQPYVAADVRKQQILDNYHKLQLQMPVDEVERILGKPDFGTARPPLHLATAPEPKDRGCSNDLAYIVRKNDSNMLDTNDVAVFLSFSPDGKLYWVRPQNLPALKQLGSPAGGK